MLTRLTCVRLSPMAAGARRLSTQVNLFQQHHGNEETLYKDHIATSPLQKAILAGGSALMALSDPWRADMVAVNGEVTGLAALRHLHSVMLESPEGRDILNDKPRISGSMLEPLAKLPPNTLGNVYATFMERNKISPDSRDKVQFVDDAELAYVMTRYRETHDLTHAVLGMPTNMVGEVLVKWFEAVQTRLPMCIGGAIFGPLRFSKRQREKYSELLPWMINTVAAADPLITVYYEKRWEQDIEEFRTELKLSLPPLPVQ